MSSQGFKRKLTAVFSADVQGYSRLMEDDEEATVRTITAYREVMIGLIGEHGGRVVDAKGDNVLAEFLSVVDALRGAVEIQKDLGKRNARLPENRRMAFRIGINLGDVIEEKGTVYGDGVNIAARLEGLAEGGGICISGTAFDHIGKRLPVGYQYLGEQTVKNIEKPVRVYRVLMNSDAAGKVIGEAKSRKTGSRFPAILGLIAVLVIVGAIALWHFHFRRPPVEPARVDKMAFPLPDKPSIAVLPFSNMSGDSKQEYLADGLTENVISALSQVPDLLVIARNSTFTYKGKPVKVQQVAEELGVRYVLEGSVQRSGDSLRVTAQLIDATKGHHIWSERYDRELKNIFALQDEITIKVVNALAVKLTQGERARIVTKGTENLRAYLKFLQAQQVFYEMTKDGNVTARRLLEEVVALDPQFARAYSLLGATYFLEVGLRSSQSPRESFKQSQEMIKKSIALDDTDAYAHSVLGYLHVFAERKYDQGIDECERGIYLAPNSASSHFWMGMVLGFAGKHEESIQHLEMALRLDPIPPAHYFANLGRSYFHAGRYEEAIAVLKKSVAPDFLLAHLYLASTYSWADRPEDARKQAAEVLRINPNYSLDNSASLWPYKNKADLDKCVEGLRKAGLPEKPRCPCCKGALFAESGALPIVDAKQKRI